MMVGSEWSLSQAARLLRQPQHRLIYLCEKGVIVPDLEDAKGRGSSRRFSARNLLEFAVALRLRDLTIPVGPVAAIIHTLRAFEAQVSREIPRFKLVQNLREKVAPDLRIIVRDGERLYFSLGVGSSPPKVYGGLDFQTLSPSKPVKLKLVEAEQVNAEAPQIRIGGFGRPEGSRHARIEVSVTGIAKDLPLHG